MGLRRVTTKFLKYLVPTLVVLAILPFSVKETMKRDSENPFMGDTLRFAINLGDYDQLSKGFMTGYSYELAQRFAANHEASSEIVLARKNRNYADSLLRGSVDVLVLPYSKGPLPDSLVATSPIDSTMMWVIRNDRTRLRAIDHWLSEFRRSPEYSYVHSRFFSGFNPYRKHTDKSVLSPYDDMLKKYAGAIGWDWKMVAAIIWNESKFRIQAQSYQGATGLMQLMPKTAATFGVYDLLDPEASIKAGTELLAHLQRSFSSYAADHDELVKFTLAAYNAGGGRIMQTIDAAVAKGLDGSRWSSVSSVLPLMSGDTVIFKGRETIGYVKVVLARYDIFSGKVSEESAESRELEAEEETERKFERLERLENVEVPLLSPDSLGRVDLGNEEARDEEEKQDGEVRDTVSKEDVREIDPDGNE